MKKTRLEELFIMCLAFAVCMMAFVATGCGEKKSCEKPRMTSGEGMVGVSLPGLGGCFSSGEGCGDCSLWSQSCKFVAAHEEARGGNADEKKGQAFIGIQNVYYEDQGCMGCSSYEATSCWAAGVQENDSWVVAAEHPSLGGCAISNIAGCGGGGEYFVKKVFDELLIQTKLR